MICNRCPRRRRGMMYVLVLGATAIVTTIGLAALLATRIATRDAAEAQDYIAARANARSAMQIALTALQADANWRTTFKAGAILLPTQIGTGRFSAQIRDTDDGVLDDDPSDPVEITALGVQGGASFVLRLPARPQKLPIDALKMCVHTGSSSGVRSGATAVSSGAPFSTNGNLRIDGNVTGDIEAGSKSGNSPSGTSKVPAPTKSIPSASAFSSYVSRATVIPYSSTMSGFILAAGFSSFGTANSDGIYLINTGGHDVTIQNARVSGTLIVIADGKKVSLQQNVLFESPSADRPVMLIDGSLETNLANGTRGLVESSLHINFNPPGAPYAGASDTDQEDYYTSGIHGLVHLTGDLSIQTYVNIRGVVLCNGQLDMNGSADFTYDPAIVASPPEGYTQAGVLQITQGSWEQGVQ